MFRVRTSLQADYEPSPALIETSHEELAQRQPIDRLPALKARRDERIAALRDFLTGGEPLTPTMP